MRISLSTQIHYFRTLFLALAGLHRDELSAATHPTRIMPERRGIVSAYWSVVLRRWDVVENLGHDRLAGSVLGFGLIRNHHAMSQHIECDFLNVLRCHIATTSQEAFALAASVELIVARGEPTSRSDFTIASVMFTT